MSNRTWYPPAPIQGQDWVEVLAGLVEEVIGLAQQRAADIAAEEQAERERGNVETDNTANPGEDERDEDDSDSGSTTAPTPSSVAIPPPLPLPPATTPVAATITKQMPELPNPFDPSLYPPAAYVEYQQHLETTFPYFLDCPHTLRSAYATYRAWHTTPNIPFRHDRSPILCDCAYAHCFGTCELAQRRWWYGVDWLMGIRTSAKPDTALESMPRETNEESRMRRMAERMLEEVQWVEERKRKDSVAEEDGGLTAVWNAEEGMMTLVGKK